MIVSFVHHFHAPNDAAHITDTRAQSSMPVWWARTTFGSRPVKSRQTKTWLRLGRLLARLFSAPYDHKAVPLQGIFHFDSAELWRLGQQRRSQCLAALLNRKRSETAVDAPDPFSGRTHSRVPAGASEH